MEGFIAIGAYVVDDLWGDARFKALGDLVSNAYLGMIEADRLYLADSYRSLQSAKGGDWSPSNPFFASPDIPNLGNSGFTASGKFTFNGQDWDAIIHPFPITEGDWIISGPLQASGYAGGVTPPDLTPGTRYYLTGLTGQYGTGTPATAGLSLSKGGPLITITSSSQADFAWLPQAATQTEANMTSVRGLPLYIPQPDTYCRIAGAVLMMGKRAGNARATAELVAKYQTFMAPVDGSAYMPWSLVA